MRFCMVGHADSRRKKNKETSLSQGSTGRKQKPLLAHATRENRNRRGSLHPRPWRAGDTTLLRIGGSAVPWLFGRPTASHDRFWCRECLRSEERRVGKECRSRCWRDDEREKQMNG